jgi:hypothetical protein
MNDHRTFAANHVIPAQAGPHLPASVSLPEEARSQKTLKNRVLAERWIPACAGMAREADVEIASTFVDTNRITASKAGVQERATRLSPWIPAFAGMTIQHF